MLMSNELLNLFWDEAAMIAMHLINFSASTMLEFQCPKHVWLTRKPDYSNLRIFGYVA